MKGIELLYLLGMRPKLKQYGFEVKTFELSREGRVQYAQWLHPREDGRTITQESVDGLRVFLRPGDVALDIGAHSGDSAIPMALAVGASGWVFALEPNAYVYPVLAKNAELNQGKTHIVPLPYAATAQDGEMVFQYSDAGYCNGGGFQGISRWRHGHAFQLRVQGRNVAAYLGKHHPELLAKIRYIKIDTEGGDEAVIHSLSELILRTKPFLRIEMYKRLNLEQRRSLYRSVAELGYDLYRVVDENQYQGEAIRESDVGRWVQFDAFCVPR